MHGRDGQSRFFSAAAELSRLPLLRAIALCSSADRITPSHKSKSFVSSGTESSVHLFTDSPRPGFHPPLKLDDSVSPCGTDPADIFDDLRNLPTAAPRWSGARVALLTAGLPSALCRNRSFGSYGPGVAKAARLR